MSMNLCMPSGLSLDPTTASASDILSGKTAYNGDGELLAGTYSLPSVNVTAGNMLSGTSAINSSGSVVNGSMRNNGRWPNADKVTFEQSKIWMYKSDGYTEGGLGANGSTFGNASASDVRSGVTFTSQNGLRLSGNMYIPARVICAVVFIGPFSTGGDGDPIFNHVLYTDSNYISSASTYSVTFRQQVTVRIRGTFHILNSGRNHSLTAGSTTLVYTTSNVSDRGYHGFDRTLTLYSGNSIYRDNEIYQIGTGYSYIVELA